MFAAGEGRRLGRCCADSRLPDQRVRADGPDRVGQARAMEARIHIYVGNGKASEASNNFNGDIDLARFHVKSTNAPCFRGMFNF